MKALRRSHTSTSSGNSSSPLPSSTSLASSSSTSPPSSNSSSSSSSASSSSSSSSSWIHLRSVLFVANLSSPSSSDRRRKSPWSRRKRKWPLTPHQWRSLSTPEGKLRDGGVGFLKRVRSRGVDPSIRAEVWLFLLGVYDLNSTSEEREAVNTQKRKEYENLQRRCKMLLKRGNGSTDDLEEEADDQCVRFMDDYKTPGLMTNQDVVSAVNTDSSDTDSCEDNEDVQLLPSFVYSDEKKPEEENSNNNNSSGETSTPSPEIQVEVTVHEDFSTWQRIIRLDALRADSDWATYSSSSTAITETKQLVSRSPIRPHLPLTSYESPPPHIKSLPTIVLFFFSLCVLRVIMAMMATAIRNSASRGTMMSRQISGLRSMSSWWKNVEPAPKDPILGVTEAFLADPSPDKVNVGVGAYRDDNGKPVVLECVREAERRIAGTSFMEYLPMGGSVKMVDETLKLAYGDNSEFIKDKRIAAVQSLSGTGACRLFADFQKRFRPDSQIYIPVPTWSNHHNIWRDAQVTQKTYHYYHPETKGLDFSGLMDDVKNAPQGSFFLLHACAHNPTGVDPTEEQWREISQLFKAKNHFAFFDMAYQGFASGDPARDAKSIRIFLEDGHHIGISQSYAKNMGLYGQRVGCLSVLCEDEKQAVTVKSQLQQLARPMYSNPPLHGAQIVSTILGDPALKGLWLKEVKVMADRIIGMRTALRESLEKLGSPLSWEHVTKQIGMFCYSGMTPEQVDRLTSEYHIYMTRNGRISMAGVTTGNVGYLANAIHEVTKSS